MFALLLFARAALWWGIGRVYLSFLALLIGIVGGLGAVGFRDLIGLVHNVAFLGRLAVTTLICLRRRGKRSSSSCR
jgi:hypothetical protein